MTALWHDPVLFLTGLVIGGMNAIAGGGMLIGFPILLGFGLSPLSANITSTTVILPGSLSSAFGYRKYLRKLRRRYLLLLIPCMAGSAIGATILRNTPSDKFQEIIPALIYFAVILFAIQPYLHFHLHSHILKKKGFGSLLAIGIGLFPVAIYGGYFGAGLGFIMLSFLGFTKLHQIHQMNGLKNLASATIGFTSLSFLYSSHLINWHYGLVMACGSIIGGYCGSLLAQKVSSHMVRIVVIMIGLGTATYLGLRNY